jgi:hypothetical protein
LLSLYKRGGKGEIVFLYRRGSWEGVLKIGGVDVGEKIINE